MSVKITWIGQAGFILKSSGASISVDPFCGQPKDSSKRLYETDIVKGSVHVDAVVSTHPHWDHFDPETYRDFILPGVIIGPTSCMKALKNSDLAGKVPGLTLNIGESTTVGDMTITATVAEHDADSIGVVVECEGKKFYFSGDTLFTSRLLMRNSRMAPDIAFICINGKLGNMNYMEASLYSDVLRAKVAVPTHYDTIENNTENPENFISGLSRLAPDTKGLILQRGVEYDAAELLR